MSNLFAGALLTQLFDGLVCGTAICLAAFVCLYLGRWASHSVRSTVLVGAVVSILLLPPLRSVTPVGRMFFMGTGWNSPRGFQSRGVSANVPVSESAPAGRMVLPEFFGVWIQSTDRRVILAIWAAGVMACGLRYTFSALALYRLRRTSRVADHEALAECVAACSKRLGVNKRVRVLVCDSAVAPMTFGVLHPTVVFPASAYAWPADQLDSVAAHELAHVMRRDRLAQILGQIASAIYWFNPLVWALTRCLSNECERACDRRVLAAGVAPDRYAGHLIAVVKSLRGVSMPGLTGLAIAGGRIPPLKKRLLAILSPDAGQSGGRSGVAMMAAFGVFMAAVAGAVPRASIGAALAGEAREWKVTLNGRPAGLEMSSGAIKISATAINLALTAGDRMTVSCENNAVSLKGDGSGMIITRLGRRVDIRREGSRMTVKGLDLDITVEGGSITIRDLEGRSLRILGGQLILEGDSGS